MKQIKITLAVIFSLCGLTVSAHDFEQNGIYYNLPTNLDYANPVVEVTYKGNSSGHYKNEYMGHVVIPSSVTHRGRTYRVTKIKDFAFEGCNALQSVVIPGSVEIIDNGAFCDCTGLTSITMQEGLKYIGSLAFKNCRSLTSLSIPKTVNKFGHFFGQIFANCSSLISLTLPDWVLNQMDIDGWNKFLEGLDRSKLIINGKKYYDIIWGDPADPFVFKETQDSVILLKFRDVVRRTGELVLPKDYKGKRYVIGPSAFSGCNLSSIIIPSGVISIEDNAFAGCRRLTSITISEGVKSIGEGAFASCNSLTSVTIPESVTSIGSEAFRHCKNLASVSIPNSVTAIKNHTFYECGITSITLPASVKSVESFAFAFCRKLTTLTISRGVISIGDCAFMRCESLTSITFPESIRRIGSEAFNGCKNLASVVIPVNVQIEYDAFDECASDLVICKRLGDFLFKNSPYDGNVLVEYIGESSNVILPAAYNGGKYSIGVGAFNGCDNISTITIPESVTSIGRNAFANCENLVKVNLPASLNEIDYGTFYGCTNLASITIPESIVSIGEFAFYNCSSLTTIVIPKYVIEIGQKAFKGCDNLSSITIPRKIVKLLNRAFGENKSLKINGREKTIHYQGA